MRTRTEMGAHHETVRAQAAPVKRVKKTMEWDEGPMLADNSARITTTYSKTPTSVEKKVRSLRLKI